MPEKPLTIEAPRQGIAPSPHVGAGDMRNLDIFSSPGIVKLNNELEAEGGSVATNTVKWIVRDPVTNSGANFYAVDAAGKVYGSTDSGANFIVLAAQPNTAGTGQGLAVWKDHLFCPRDTAMDVYGPLSSSPNWNDGWDTIGTATWHPMLVSKLDGKLYFGCGRYIGVITEASGENFADDTASTYAGSTSGVFDDNSLDLPEDYEIRCLAELGNNLMIGSGVGSAIDDNKIADIFTWDGSSTSFGNPIQMAENGVNAMVNIGGNLYISAGLDGRIYKSNGVQAWPIGQVPESIADTSGGKYTEVYPGAIMNHRGKLYFGLSSSGTVADGIGIYSLTETSQGNILNFEHTISTETMGSSNALIIGSLNSISRDQFLAGFTDNATHEIDILSTSSYAYGTNYTKAYFESRLMDVGTIQNRRTFTAMEFFLAKELTSGEGIQIKYRINLTDTFITIGTYTTAEIGTEKTSFRTEEISIPECEQLQIRVELLGDTNSSPEFKRLMLF